MATDFCYQLHIDSDEIICLRRLKIILLYQEIHSVAAWFLLNI